MIDELSSDANHSVAVGFLDVECKKGAIIHFAQSANGLTVTNLGPVACSISVQGQNVQIHTGERLAFSEDEARLKSMSAETGVAFRRSKTVKMLAGVVQLSECSFVALSGRSTHQPDQALQLSASNLDTFVPDRMAQIHASAAIKFFSPLNLRR